MTPATAAALPQPPPGLHCLSRSRSAAPAAAPACTALGAAAAALPQRLPLPALPQPCKTPAPRRKPPPQAPPAALPQQRTTTPLPALPQRRTTPAPATQATVSAPAGTRRPQPQPQPRTTIALPRTTLTPPLQPGAGHRRHTLHPQTRGRLCADNFFRIILNPAEQENDVFADNSAALLMAKNKTPTNLTSLSNAPIYQAEIPMSSSNRVPFQDITNRQIKDPRELKRQRDRERYAKNKDEILKRRHQLRELKKQSTAPVNDENTLHDTDDIGESVLTNIQFRATEEVLNLQLLGDLYLQHIGLFPTNHVTRTTLAELKMFKVFSQLIIYPFVFT